MHFQENVQLFGPAAQSFQAVFVQVADHGEEQLSDLAARLVIGLDELHRIELLARPVLVRKQPDRVLIAVGHGSHAISSSRAAFC